MNLLAYDVRILRAAFGKPAYFRQHILMATDKFTIWVLKNPMKKMLKKLILMPNSWTLE